MSYLLGITVGPVQSFIEESRKLSDLYSSSDIISRIMKKCYEIIKEKDIDAELIYPKYNFNNKEIKFSNYILLEVTKCFDLSNWESGIYSTFNKNKYDNYVEVLRENFHIFWAFKELNKYNYEESYNELTTLLTNLKNTYEFEQAIQSGNIKKCSLCGKRNIENLNENQKSKYSVIDEEELCKLCFLKRKVKNKDERIESIYSVAISSWKEKNKEILNENNIIDDLSSIFTNFDKYFSISEIDTLINSIQNIEKLSLKKRNEIYSNFINNKNEQSIAKIQQLNEIKKRLSNIPKPTYEYCFIKFDVDNLGKWMSGFYLNEKKCLREFQESLSEILIKFSLELKNILKEKTRCSVIYSGGDDFLGILPTENIITVVNIIEELFNSLVVKEVKNKYKITKDITYSICINIAQCKDSMKYALIRTTLELEKVKDRFEKNTIPKNGAVINYIVNNGKEIKCYMQKNVLKNLFNLSIKSKELREDFSFQYIKTLENEIKMFNFINMCNEEVRYFNRIIMHEIDRLVKRSSKDLEDYIDELKNFIGQHIEDNEIEYGTNCNEIDIENIINVIKLLERFSLIDISEV